MKQLFFAFLFLFTTQLEAQWVAPPRARSCWCCCYMDPTYSNYDCNYYGYVDNINYPDRYDFPVNRCFRSRPQLRCNPHNQNYFQNCIRTTAQKQH